MVLAKKEKALGLERCEAVLYPGPQIPLNDGRTTRALWAGLKPLEGNHYTVDHCQPMDQKSGCQGGRLDLLPPSENTYDYADYSSITYGSIKDADPDLTPPLSGERLSLSSSFENIGFVPGEEPADVNRLGTRAAYLLGTRTSHLSRGVSTHLYEMMTPRTNSSRRHKSLDHGPLRQVPIISGPTNLPPIRLPPLNSRYGGHYNLKGLNNGCRTLMPNGSPHQALIRMDRKYAHVSLDRSGAASTKLAPTTPTDNVYASPITSPVI